MVRSWFGLQYCYLSIGSLSVRMHYFGRNLVVWCSSLLFLQAYPISYSAGQPYGQPTFASAPVFSQPAASYPVSYSQPAFQQTAYSQPIFAQPAATYSAPLSPVSAVPFSQPLQYSQPVFYGHPTTQLTQTDPSVSAVAKGKEEIFKF